MPLDDTKLITDEEIETAVVDKGLTAPRVTKQAINAIIVDAFYYIFPGTTVTVCCIKLKNGFCVIGKSAAASVENFDEELGQQIAYTDAYNQIWALEGYLLKELGVRGYSG